jgi:hypothetical protein
VILPNDPDLGSEIAGIWSPVEDRSRETEAVLEVWKSFGPGRLPPGWPGEIYDAEIGFACVWNAIEDKWDDCDGASIVYESSTLGDGAEHEVAKLADSPLEIAKYAIDLAFQDPVAAQHSLASTETERNLRRSLAAVLVAVQCPRLQLWRHS